MILRKPYAFFIKYFRIINLIMAVLMAILIYRTIVIGKFLTDYLQDYATASSDFMLGNYINFYSFLLVLVVIIFTIVVTSVMFVKDKPKKLYIFNLIVYIALLVLYGVDYSVMNNIYDRILDIRLTSALRDITYIAAGIQIISCIITIIRATGFDIKQFNFGSDLEELEIDVKDNEEFEVAVEFDKNKMKRNIRGKLREFKYFYVEHKFVVNVSAIILVVIIGFTVFMTKSVYTANYKEAQSFVASNLSLNIKSSYLTQTDQNDKKIVSDDKTLVVVRIDVRKLTPDEVKRLNTGLITLQVGGNSYGQTSAYNEDLTDIGTPYTNDKLSVDFTNYILAFEIPKSLAEETMTLKINDNVSYIRGEIGAKNIYVKLKPMDLTDEKQTEEKKFTETVSFSGSVLGESTFTITQFEIGSKFKVEYPFCSKKDKCGTSYEYVTPTATGNYPKTLIKINGTFDEDESMNLNTMTNLYYFLNEFATINYQVDGKWYSHKIDSKRIKPKLGKENGITYIEVNKNVEKATSVYFTFQVRNYNYKYVLK